LCSAVGCSVKSMVTCLGPRVAIDVEELLRRLERDGQRNQSQMQELCSDFATLQSRVSALERDHGMRASGDLEERLLALESAPKDSGSESLQCFEAELGELRRSVDMKVDVAQLQLRNRGPAVGIYNEIGRLEDLLQEKVSGQQFTELWDTFEWVNVQIKDQVSKKADKERVKRLEAAYLDRFHRPEPDPACEFSVEQSYKVDSETIFRRVGDTPSDEDSTSVLPLRPSLLET